MRRNDKLIPSTIVPVSSKALLRATTPSRRRRIIYESARRLTREYISHAIYNLETFTNASRVIQHEWRLFQERSRLHHAVSQIQRLFKIIQAKNEVGRRKVQKHHRASIVITGFFRRRYQFHLTTSAIMIQKYWRGAIARMLAQEAKLTLLEMECSAIVIQSFVRSYLARVAFERRYYPPSAILIQRYYRVYLAKKKAKRQVLMNRCRKTLQSWWRNMMIFIRLLRYAEEENRLRSLARQQISDENMNLLSDSESIASEDQNVNNEETECVIPSDDENSQPVSIDSQENLDDEVQSTLSSITTITESNGDDEYQCENDDSSVTTVKSIQSSSTTDDINEEIKRAMELERRRNQSALILQNQIRMFLIKRRKKKLMQSLKEKMAAKTLSNKLWTIYQNFIAQREQRKRDRECRAVIMIQTYIRSFLATRFVEECREAMYGKILDQFCTEFNIIDTSSCSDTTSTCNKYQWLPKTKLPSFLTCNDECDHDAKNSPSHINVNVEKENHNPEVATEGSSTTSSFHDDWIQLLPESSRLSIPKGCNLYGVDLDDEGCSIRCMRFENDSNLIPLEQSK